MPDLVTWLIGLALLALIAFLYWANRRYPSPSKPREHGYLLTYCAWCIHPDSPVYNQPCGPVCIGARRCSVRVVKR
jgi:hypothetical protein